MSGFISTLLAKEKTSIRSILDKLELASGEKAIDARFISEIIVQSKLKIRQLGLDPSDTSAEELHEALINLVSLHDKFLNKAIGANLYSNTDEIISDIVKFTKVNFKNKQIWGIKHSVSKRILKKMPPKVLMKNLGYRSIDSMLKIESIDDLFAGIRIAESKEYLSKFFDSYKNLKPNDFESRNIIIKHLNNDKWKKISSLYVDANKNNLICIKEMGSIIILPLSVAKLKGITILLLPLLLHNINELHIYSSYFKFEQVKHNFGEILSKSIKNTLNTNINMVGLELNWKIIRDHFGKLTINGDTDVFMPHIQTDDLEKNSVEEALFKIEPALHFWYGNDCLGVPYPKGTVSFNIMDIAFDYVNSLDFINSSTSYLKNSIWDEILKRYLSEGPLQEQVLQQIDSQSFIDEYEQQDISSIRLTS